MLLLLLQALFWLQLSVIILLSVPFTLSLSLSVYIAFSPFSSSELYLDRHCVFSPGSPPSKSPDADNVKLLWSFFRWIVIKWKININKHLLWCRPVLAKLRELWRCYATWWSLGNIKNVQGECFHSSWRKLLLSKVEKPKKQTRNKILWASFWKTKIKSWLINKVQAGVFHQRSHVRITLLYWVQIGDCARADSTLDSGKLTKLILSGSSCSPEVTTAQSCFSPFLVLCHFCPHCVVHLRTVSLTLLSRLWLLSLWWCSCFVFTRD